MAHRLRQSLKAPLVLILTAPHLFLQKLMSLLYQPTNLSGLRVCPSLKLEKSRNAGCLSGAWNLWGSGPSSLFPCPDPLLSSFSSLFLCGFFFPTPPSPAACSSKCLLNSSPGTRWLWGFCSQRFKFRKTRVWEEHEEHCSQVQPRRNESQFPAHFLEESSIFESEVSEPFQLVFIYSKMVQWLFL